MFFIVFFCFLNGNRIYGYCERFLHTLIICFSQLANILPFLMTLTPSPLFAREERIDQYINSHHSRQFFLVNFKTLQRTNSPNDKSLIMEKLRSSLKNLQPVAIWILQPVFMEQQNYNKIFTDPTDPLLVSQ